MKRVILSLLAVTAVLLAGALVILRSHWFENRVREKLIAVVENASGGRVEIGSFEYDWHGLTATVTSFVLHGNEAPGQPPLFRAAKIQVGMRIVSLLARRVDLASLLVDRPQVSITVHPDGRTNVPVPRKRLTLEDLLNLKARRVTVQHGSAEYNSQRIPLDLKAEDAGVQVRYDPANQAYAGDLRVGLMQVNAPHVSDARFAMEARLSVNRTGLKILASKLSSGKSEIETSGTIADWSSPRGALAVKASVRPEDLNRPFHSPLDNRGTVAFDGSVDFHCQPACDWTVQGKAVGRGLGYRGQLLMLSNAGASARVKLTSDGMTVPEFTVNALGGVARGHLQITDWKKWSVSGTVRNISVHEAAALRALGAKELDGTLRGPIQAEGYFREGGLEGIRAEGNVDLQPVAGGLQLQGSVPFKYDERAHEVTLDDATVSVGSSHAQLSGVMGQTLTVHATSPNLNDLWSVLPLIGESAPKDFPVVLHGGLVRFDGAITGAATNPRVSGQLEVTKFAVGGEEFDRLSGSIDLTDSSLVARNVTASQGVTQFQGSGQIGLKQWTWSDASPLSGSIAVKREAIEKLLADRKWKAPVTGVLSATAQVRGTVGSPQGSADLQAESINAYGEHLDHLRASVTLIGDTFEVTDAKASAGAGTIDAKGTYKHDAPDWTTGQIRFDVVSRNLDLAHIKKLEQWRTGIGGQGDLSASGAARLTKEEFRLQSLTSQGTLRNVTFDGKAYGSLSATANSRGDVLGVQAKATLLGTPVEGSGEWKLAGDDPGHGEIDIKHVTISALHELVPNPSRKDLPFEGFVEGKIVVDGPLRKPDDLKAEARIQVLQLNASSGAKPRAGAQARDLVLRNAKPLVLEATTKGIEIRSLQLVGTDTTLDASGRLHLDSKVPWDLHVNGTINLAILQIFNADLLGSGISVVDATVRGSLTEPDVEGRLELRNASLYLEGLPTGLDQANGLIIFDRNRATVDTLTATTGGGRVVIQRGSFVGFPGPVLLYRVQASADNVRYRSPDGVSLTANAALNMIGTSENSVLSGTVTVIRVGFNPTTDVGGLLANTVKPVSAPTAPNEYLRGIQFDVRIESSASLEIQTSLTRNVEAEANLRLRGTPDRPVIVGNIAVNEGQIDFFGNRYSINRGEVNFYNTAKIDPIIDMDLETTVRGITVDISFTGPLNKLNFSYRSDPPLQANDIIALLAVGRTPLTANPVASTQTNTNSNYLSMGSNNLLEQAITAPASGRLQRFFGVSHLRLDPQLSDITSVPQARLSLEQQLSKEVTLTYITNVTRTQEQIVRVEWDLSRQWSVVALRDENGEFSLDVQYRRRFK
jgi:translocation and assembly module TamB